MITPEQLAKSGTEHAEQCALFCWANFAARYGFAYANKFAVPHELAAFVPVPALQWLHAIPNAGARGNKIAAAQLKAEGVKAGVADTFLPWPMRLSAPLGMTVPVLYCGLYVELKKLNGVPSDVSDEQIEFAKFVKSQGYAWFPAFGWKQAATIIQAYITCETPTLTPKQAQVLQRVAAA